MSGPWTFVVVVVFVVAVVVGMMGDIFAKIEEVMDESAHLLLCLQ